MRARFLQLARTAPSRYLVVDATGDPDVVHRGVVERLATVLPESPVAAVERQRREAQELAEREQREAQELAEREQREAREKADHEAATAPTQVVDPTMAMPAVTEASGRGRHTSLKDEIFGPGDTRR